MCAPSKHEALKVSIDVFRASTRPCGELPPRRGFALVLGNCPDCNSTLGCKRPA